MNGFIFAVCLFVGVVLVSYGVAKQNNIASLLGGGFLGVFAGKVIRDE